MKAFFDSSALTKRYVKEAKSEIVDKILRDCDDLGISVLCFPEIMSVLNRLKRERNMNGTEYQINKQRVAEDLEDASVCTITAVSIARAVALIEESPLRTLDAFHVAAALEWECDVFVTFDKQQSKAAKRAGLEVVGI